MLSGISGATQYVADLQCGDAVSAIVTEYDRLLNQWGVPATIAAAGWGDEMRWRARAYQQCSEEGDDHLHIYHFSVACSPMLAQFRRRKGRHMLVYHNVTPPHWFVGYDEETLWSVGLARSELAGLRDCVDLAASYSNYNVQELRDVGFERVSAVPFILSPAHFDHVPHADTMASLRQEAENLLFVGRLAPNKRHEDAIRAFYYYQRLHPQAVLHLVGPFSVPAYVERLRDLVGRLGLQGKVRLPGRVSDEVLAAYYRSASLYISMSEHEGFCVPLLEAMHYQIPVVAFAAAAVPDTMGNAGILVREKRFDAIAEMLHLIATDARVRERLLSGQRERLKAFDEEQAAAGLRQVIGSFQRERV